MQILRKIIFKEWITFFIGSVVVLVFILCLGHLLSNLLRPNAVMTTIFQDLFLEIPTFLVKILPVSCLMASLFSLNRLKNKNELVAIFASGFSRFNFIITIGGLGLIVGMFLFSINAYLVPYSKLKQIILLNKRGNSTISINVINSGKIWFKSKNYFISYNSFDSKNNLLNGLNLYFFDESFNFSEKIIAKNAEYISENTWKLNQVYKTTNLSNNTFPSNFFENSVKLNLNESITDFRKINADISTLSIWKLFEYITVLKQNKLNYDEYFVSFLDKFAASLTCVILSILSAVAIFNPNRRSSSFGMNVSFVMSFTFFYWFIYSYFLTLGQSSKLNPYLATFGVPGIFCIYLVFFFIYHRKLR